MKDGVVNEGFLMRFSSSAKRTLDDDQLLNFNVLSNVVGLP